MIRIRIHAIAIIISPSNIFPRTKPTNIPQAIVDDSIESFPVVTIVTNWKIINKKNNLSMINVFEVIQ